MNNEKTSLASQISLCDTLDRLLNQGIAVSGDIVISVAGVELLYIGLRGLLASMDALDERPASLNCFSRSPSTDAFFQSSVEAPR